MPVMRMVTSRRMFNVPSLTDIQIVRCKALALLARREHSRAELTRKLRQRGYDNALIVSVVEQLVSEALLSEVRFAEAFIRSRMGSGYGPLRVAEELCQRGISRADTQKFLQELEPNWPKILFGVWRKKFSQPPNNMKEQAQQMRYLLYRGFTSAQVNTLMRHVSQLDFLANE